MSDLVIHDQPSYFRVGMQYVTAYTPAVMTMLAVAALVFKIWGGVVLLCTVASCALAYAFFHKQIHWFINSNDWLPSALRSMFAPVLAFFGGPVGAVAAAAMSFVSYAGEQWNLYDQRRILQGANSQLGSSNTVLQQQAENLQRQVQQAEAAISEIVRLSPDIELGLNQVRVQVEQNQTRLQQFLQYYQSVLANPQVAAQVSTIARVEVQMTQLNQQLQECNTRIQARVEQGTDAAEVQYQNLETVTQLIVALRGIIAGLIQPVE